jgi:hypothetical protein
MTALSPTPPHTIASQGSERSTADALEPLPLIYILSSGRSGSTLLDLLLGQHERMWTLGELQVLPWELREHRAPCACGQPLEDCEFFGPLLPSLPLASGAARLEHFRESHGFGRVLRSQLLLDLLLGGPRGRRRQQAAAYAELNAELLRRLWSAAQKRQPAGLAYLVDSSKDLYRLAWLATSGRFALKVIHVYKDPRAFVHSMTRREGARPGSVLRFATRWLIENALMAYLGSTLPPQNFLCLDYETLAGDPQSALLRLGRFLGLELAPNHGQRLRRETVHAISGNEMRWQPSSIELDQRWRKDLPDWARRLTGVLTWPWWLLRAGRHLERAAERPTETAADRPPQRQRVA